MRRSSPSARRRSSTTAAWTSPASAASTDSNDDGGDSGRQCDGGEEGLEDLEAACADGDFGACDDLYFASELGSELEEFGSTCGGIAEPQDGLCESTNGGEGEATGGATDGFDDGNFEDIIADAYEETFGISEEKAAVPGRADLRCHRGRRARPRSRR